MNQGCARSGLAQQAVELRLICSAKFQVPNHFATTMAEGFFFLSMVLVTKLMLLAVLRTEYAVTSAPFGPTLQC